MVSNQEITDQFIQNLKSNPNKVNDLTGEMKKSLKKQILETNILPQIHKISSITKSYGITTYLGMTFKKWSCIRKMLDSWKFWVQWTIFLQASDNGKMWWDRHKTYIVPVGRCSLNTSQEKHNYLDMHSNAFTFLGKSNKKKERVPDGPTIKYSQGIQNSCIISSLESALYYIVDELASKYIIRCKQ